jgi:hypothetical protein
VATFAEAITQPQAREEKSAGELTARTYTPRSKFSTSGKGGAVAHVYLPLQQDDLPSKVRISVTDESDTAAVKSRSSAATLQAIRVCLPGTLRARTHPFLFFLLIIVISCLLLEAGMMNRQCSGEWRV